MFTNLETKVIRNLKNILEETEMVASVDLISSEDEPKEMRGAIASLIKKGVIDIDYDYPTNTGDTTLYWVWWDEEAVASV